MRNRKTTTITLPNGKTCSWVSRERFAVWSGQIRTTFKDYGDAWEYARLVRTNTVWQYGYTVIGDYWYKGLISDKDIDDVLVSPHDIVILRPAFIGKHRFRRMARWSLVD